MKENRDVFTVVGLATCIKVLLVWTYRSTDFEVHRNWMALTYSLPINKWYTEATSQWTLDYPPLFAWFEWTLSQFAPLADPHMLHISNLNYASRGTILFQRFSVILSDLVLVYAAVIWQRILWNQTCRLERLFQPMVLVMLILNPGLLIVDHIHFQYNGILMGLMLLSMARIYQGHVLWGSLWFCVLLNMKHIYLYIAPPFFIYLLRSYVLKVPTWKESFYRLSKLGGIVISVFAVSFGPFIYYGQLPQIASRLFPLKRGLLHAYWAPNIWALYAGADKILAIIGSKMGWSMGKHTLTSGLVQDAQFAVLPNVPSLVTAAIALALMTVPLYRLFTKPTPRCFLTSTLHCGLISFLVGFHVHEKAILIPLLCLLPLAVIESTQAKMYSLLSCVGHYSLFPLLFTKQETPIKVVLVLLHAAYTCCALEKRHRCTQLSPTGKLYLLGLIPLFLYGEIFHTFLTPRHEFLPLMATSLYCALGVAYCSIYSIISDGDKAKMR